MGRFASEMRAGSFWAVALAVAVALTTFQVTLQLISGVLYPVVHKLTKLNLTDISFDLTESRRLGLNPYLDTVRFGPSLVVLLSGLVTVFVLAQGYRWSLNASAEGTVECPYCLSAIPSAAIKCSYCGSDQPDTESNDSNSLTP